MGPKMPTPQALKEHEVAAFYPEGSLLEGDQTSDPTDTLLEIRETLVAVPF